MDASPDAERATAAERESQLSAIAGRLRDAQMPRELLDLRCPYCRIELSHAYQMVHHLRRDLEDHPLLTVAEVEAVVVLAYGRDRFDRDRGN